MEWHNHVTTRPSGLRRLTRNQFFSEGVSSNLAVVASINFFLIFYNDTLNFDHFIQAIMKVIELCCVYFFVLTRGICSKVEFSNKNRIIRDCCNTGNHSLSKLDPEGALFCCCLDTFSSLSFQLGEIRVQLLSSPLVG